jgi:hypothetical protein
VQAEGVREAFCVLPAHTNPQKVSRGLMQPLSDAVCYSSQMAKVELERDCLENRIEPKMRTARVGSERPKGLILDLTRHLRCTFQKLSDSTLR